MLATLAARPLRKPDEPALRRLPLHRGHYRLYGLRTTHPEMAHSLLRRAACRALGQAEIPDLPVVRSGDFFRICCCIYRLAGLDGGNDEVRSELRLPVHEPYLRACAAPKRMAAQRAAFCSEGARRGPDCDWHGRGWPRLKSTK